MIVISLRLAHRVKCRLLLLGIFVSICVLLHFNLEQRFYQLIFFSETSVNKFFHKIKVFLLICSFPLNKVHSTFKFMCLFCLNLGS